VLADFQSALADLVASPAWTLEVRDDPGRLRRRYALSDHEARQLEAVARARGMSANCMIYRANRLAPLAIEAPLTCAALGDDLHEALCAFWQATPDAQAQFLPEAARYLAFIEHWLAARAPDHAARAIAAAERAAVERRLDEQRRA
jgi:hypothetical protein